MIKIAQYPQLKLITWNIHCEEIDEKTSLDLYERNWRLIDEPTLTHFIGSHQRDDAVQNIINDTYLCGDQFQESR